MRNWRFILIVLALFSTPAMVFAVGEDATVTPSAAKATPSKKLRIAVVGDVMAQGLSQAIVRLLEGDKQLNIDHKNFAKGSSGFVRNDYYDWNSALPKILENNELDYILVFMGSNDRQSIRIKGRSYKAKTPKWREEYIHRIDRFLDGIAAKGVKTIWLGQPISRGRSFSNDMALFNEIYRQHVESHEGVYFDVWTLFANEDGKYSRSGPDVSGQIRKLRAANGIHFTRRGYDKLAFQIVELLQNIESGGIAAEASDEGEVVDVEKYDLSKGLADDAIIVARKEDDVAAKDSKAEAASSVFDDDAAQEDENDDDAGKKAATEPDPNIPLWKNVLVNGYVIPAEFGRSDDFSWPRN